MSTTDFGVDLNACRESLHRRQEQAYLERETRRQTAHDKVLGAIRATLPHHPHV